MQIQLYGKKIFVFRASIDFRKSIDGLSALVTNSAEQNPQSGIYLFYNKKRDKIKCLSWHKNGFILLYKRLEQGRFYFDFKNSQGIAEMNMDELQWLLAGLEWQKMRHWRELSYDKFS
jgi:transposase